MAKKCRHGLSAAARTARKRLVVLQYNADADEEADDEDGDGEASIEEETAADEEEDDGLAVGVVKSDAELLLSLT